MGKLINWLRSLLEMEPKSLAWEYDGVEHQIRYREGEIYLARYTSNRFKRTGYRWSAFPRSDTFPPQRIKTIPPYKYPPMNCSLKDAKMTVEEWATEQGWHVIENNE